ncbi:MAG: 50S ribosomal protein L13 [Microgenomates group bacterium]
MKTYQPKHKDIKREWHLVDAKGAVLGRMATRIVSLLMGKHKPVYSNHMDMGDYVVVTNVEKVEVTGRKRKQKVYQKHSGYPGGFKEISFEKMITEHPERVIELAVSRMLPNNRLRQKRMRRLKIFAGGKNPYKSKFKSGGKK